MVSVTNEDLSLLTNDLFDCLPDQSRSIALYSKYHTSSWRPPAIGPTLVCMTPGDFTDTIS